MAGPPVGARGRTHPATEAEVERLAERIDAELRARGGARPTSKWIAECVAGVCGWVPR